MGSGGYDRSFTYDGIGNLQSQTGVGDLKYPAPVPGGVVRPHAVTRVEQPAGTTIHTFGYDGSGNMTSRAMQGQTAQTLLYDYDSRLERITKGTEVTGFLYDADGGRVKQMVGTASSWTTTTLYAGGMFEQTGSTPTKWYLFGDGPVAFRQGSTLNYLIDDHLSSTSLTYTHSTDAAKKQLYYPFGDLRYTQTPPTTRGFTGQRRDGSGLMFYQSRYYDPLLGRFTQPDTIIPNPANPQDFNRYTYVLNNPVLYSDPTGHVGWPGHSCDAACAAANQAWTGAVAQSFVDNTLATLKVWEWAPQAVESLGALTVESAADFVGLGDQIRDNLGYSPSQAIVDSVVEQAKDVWAGDPDAIGAAASDVIIAAATAGAASAAKARWASKVGAANQVTNAATDANRVGRWMSAEEHAAIVETGMVQPGRTGVVNVAHPADINSFMRQAPPGSRYVEFDVPSSSLVQGGKEGWAVIPGPDSIYSRLNNQRGVPPYQFPSARNIEWVASRLSVR